MASARHVDFFGFPEKLIACYIIRCSSLKRQYVCVKGRMWFDFKFRSEYSRRLRTCSEKLYLTIKDTKPEKPLEIFQCVYDICAKLPDCIIYSSCTCVSTGSHKRCKALYISDDNFHKIQRKLHVITMAVTSLSTLTLVLILAFCILQYKTQAEEDQQMKASDSTSLHVLTSATSENAKRRGNHFRALRTVLQFDQRHRSSTAKPITLNLVENEASHQSLTTVLPFQKEPAGGIPKSVHAVQSGQSPRIMTTLSWTMESGPSSETLQSVDLYPVGQLFEEETTISWETENGFGDDGILNYGTRGNDFEDFDTTPNVAVEYNNPNKPATPNNNPKTPVVSPRYVENPLNESGFAKDKRRPDGDTFPCPPCVCFYRHKNVMANCTQSALYRFPRNLPQETRGILLLRNHLRSFDLADIQDYTSLTTLSISWNGRLRAIKNVSKKSQNLSITEIHIGRGNIETIEDGSFKMAPNLLRLNLEHNIIRNITNSTFDGLGNLLILNLSQNNINFIELGSFDHLSSLISLDLSRNEDLGYSPKHFSPRLFENLPYVKYFGIDGNSEGQPAYPNEVLEKFPNLEVLSVDGLDYRATFQPGIKTLKHFTTLEIGKTGNCYMTCVNSTFFENLPRIRHLYFTACDHLRFKSEIIPINRHITRLEIKYCHGYDLFTALEDMHVFQNSSLTNLALVRLNPHSGRLPCRSLRRKHAENLQHLNLKVLDLSDNMLALIANDFTRLLPKSLERLILKKNKFGSIGIGLDRLAFMTQLIELDVSFQNTQYYYSITLEALQNCPHNLASRKQSGNNCLSTYNSQDVEATVDTTPKQSYCDADLDYTDVRKPKVWDNSSLLCEESCPVRLMPPNLRILRAPFFDYFGFGVLNFNHHHNSLKEFYFSNSFLTYARYSYVPNHSKIADMSNNYCSYLNHGFFRPNNSVTQLLLQNNLLGSEFADDDSGVIFAELGRARYVDVSNNLIYKLPYRFFKGLKSVRTLKLANNKLEALNVSFSHMKELRHLDLSRNSITWISKDTMKDLDIIASHHLLTVDLTSNPIPCTCAGLELIYWMSKTNVYFLHQKYLRCRISNNVHENIGDFDERMKYLQKNCASMAIIIVMCVACFVLVSILVGIFLMYRFRWRLRYLRNIAMAKLLGFMPKEEENHNYKFDAYFLFSDNARAFVVRQCLQELEVKRGHKLCIADRNFMPGTFEVSNIVGAVQHSAKTVVVVTPDLYEEDYAEYTIKMALMEEIYNKRSVLHLCVYQPMPDEEMAQCHDLLMVMKRDDYTEYPPENEVREEIMENFWDRLSQAIGHANYDDADADDNDQ